MKKKIKIEFWDSKWKGAPSKLVRVEEWEDNIESFIRFYELNKELKYCNGTHYTFVDKEIKERYFKNFISNYNTIDNYYKGGIVD